jgi:hypothetical protein
MNTISGLFGFDPMDPIEAERGKRGGKPWGACKLKICLALWCNKTGSGFTDKKYTL